MNQEEKRPCMIVAHADLGYAVRACRTFRQLGWDVHLADSGPDVRRLARMVEPRAIVMDSLLPSESGWLTCDKLRLERPETRVVLVAAKPGAHEENFGVFVGAAAVVDQCEGMQALLEEIVPAVVV